MKTLNYKQMIENDLPLNLSDVIIGIDHTKSQTHASKNKKEEYLLITTIHSIKSNSFLALSDLKKGDEIISIGEYSCGYREGSSSFIFVKNIKDSKNLDDEKNNFNKFLIDSAKNDSLVKIEYIRKKLSDRTANITGKEEYEERECTVKAFPLFKVSDEDYTEVILKKDISAEVKLKVFNQDSAIDSISDCITLYNAGLNDEDKPLGSFLLAGPTGVGKTEVAKEFANQLGFGMVRLDMSEYMEKHNASRIIGPPPGYLGYDEKPILETTIGNDGKKIILLLDEIEKAHSSVHKLFLQAMDNGEITLGNGSKINFKNTLILMTSNAGIKGSDLKLDNELLKKSFPPEFIGRLDAVLEFNKLNDKSIISIIDKFLSGFKSKLKNKGVDLEITDSAMKVIASKGYSIEYGARGIKNTLKKEIYINVAKLLVKNKNSDVLIDSKLGNLIFKQKSKFEVVKAQKDAA